MKKNNFIPFLFSIACIYLLRLFWEGIVLFLSNKVPNSTYSTIIDISSPYISYWIIKKYLSNNIRFKELFIDYTSIKKYALSLFVLEGSVLLILLIIGIDLLTIISMYLFFFLHIFCFVWYLPFLILAYIDKKRKK